MLFSVSTRLWRSLLCKRGTASDEQQQLRAAQNDVLPPRAVSVVSAARPTAAERLQRGDVDRGATQPRGDGTGLCEVSSVPNGALFISGAFRLTCSRLG